MELCPRPMLSGTGASRSGGRRIFSRAVCGIGAAPKRSGESGKGHLKAIIWTTILVAFIYVAAIVLPVLINEYQFQDSLQNIARFASVNRKSGEQIRKDIMDEAQKEDLPVQADDIKVQSNAGNIHINAVSYTHLTLPTICSV